MSWNKNSDCFQVCCVYVARLSHCPADPACPPLCYDLHLLESTLLCFQQFYLNIFIQGNNPSHTLSWSTGPFIPASHSTRSDFHFHYCYVLYLQYVLTHIQLATPSVFSNYIFYELYISVRKLPWLSAFLETYMFWSHSTFQCTKDSWCMLWVTSPSSNMTCLEKELRNNEPPDFTQSLPLSLLQPPTHPSKSLQE